LLLCILDCMYLGPCGGSVLWFFAPLLCYFLALHSVAKREGEM